MSSIVDMLYNDIFIWKSENNFEEAINNRVVDSEHSMFLIDNNYIFIYYIKDNGLC